MIGVGLSINLKVAGAGLLILPTIIAISAGVPTAGAAVNRLSGSTTFDQSVGKTAEIVYSVPAGVIGRYAPLNAYAIVTAGKGLSTLHTMLEEVAGAS